MTETEWLACDNPEPLLGELRGEVYGNFAAPTEGSPTRCSNRKIALFTHAVCVSVPYTPLNRPTLHGMELLDQFSADDADILLLLPVTSDRKMP